jgi:hypothetical protein
LVVGSFGVLGFFLRTPPPPPPLLVLLLRVKISVLPVAVQIPTLRYFAPLLLGEDLSKFCGGLLVEY